MRDLAAAGIAGDDAELGAEHVVQQQRQIVGGGAGIAGADDQLLVEHVLERLHRRVAAHVADIDVAVGAAEIDELVRIVLHRHVAEQRLQHRAGEDRADRGAVLGRDRIDVAGGAVGSRAAHVLHDDGRIAGHGVAEMPRQQPRIGVVAAAGRRADDHRDLLALEELLDRFLRRRDGRGAQQAGNRGGGKPDAKPDRHRTDPRCIPKRPLQSPRGSLAAGGFQAGLPLSTAPAFRHARIIAAGCGRGSGDALGSRRRLPRHADAGGEKQTQLVRTMIDFYGLTSPNVQKIFIMLEEMRAALQFQAGGRLGQRAALAGFRQAQPEQENPGDRRHRRPGRQALHGVRVRRDPDVSRREDRQVHAEGHGEEIRRHPVADGADVRHRPGVRQLHALQPVRAQARQRLFVQPLQDRDAAALRAARHAARPGQISRRRRILDRRHGDVPVDAPARRPTAPTSTASRTSSAGSRSCRRGRRSRR